MDVLLEETSQGSEGQYVGRAAEQKPWTMDRRQPPGLARRAEDGATKEAGASEGRKRRKWSKGMRGV